MVHLRAHVGSAQAQCSERLIWGLFFRPFSAFIGFRITTTIPFAGVGTVAVLVRIAFAAFTLCTILNHVYHLVAMLGISLEL